MDSFERVNVEFTVTNKEHFLDWLHKAEQECGFVLGFRADDEGLDKRAALRAFVDQMEHKLRKNEHKSNWRTKPIDALLKLMLLEIEEFKVAHEFFAVSESRPELVDIANFALMLHDRLGMFDQQQVAGGQVRKAPLPESYEQ